MWVDLAWSGWEEERLVGTRLVASQNLREGGASYWRIRSGHLDDASLNSPICLIDMIWKRKFCCGQTGFFTMSGRSAFNMPSTLLLWTKGNFNVSNFKWSSHIRSRERESVLAGPVVSRQLKENSPHALHDLRLGRCTTTRLLSALKKRPKPSAFLEQGNLNQNCDYRLKSMSSLNNVPQ